MWWRSGQIHLSRHTSSGWGNSLVKDWLCKREDLTFIPRIHIKKITINNNVMLCVFSSSAREVEAGGLGLPAPVKQWSPVKDFVPKSKVDSVWENSWSVFCPLSAPLHHVNLNMDKLIHIKQPTTRTQNSSYLNMVVYTFNLALEGQRQEECGFESSLGYLMRTPQRKSTATHMGPWKRHGHKARMARSRRS